jgi:hypothetical protein
MSRSSALLHTPRSSSATVDTKPYTVGDPLSSRQDFLKQYNEELQNPCLDEEEDSVREVVRGIESEHMRAVAEVHASVASTTAEAVRTSLASTTASRTRPSDAPAIASPEPPPGTGRNNLFSPPPTDVCRDDDPKPSPSYRY